MTNDILWQTKLHARLHDPAEKALVLLRDPAGHEGGTSKVLHRLLRFEHINPDRQIDNDNADVLHAVLFKKGIPAEIYETVKRADWWAAAADRPQWPMQEITTDKGKTLKVADYAQVRFTSKPVLIHPLTGAQFDLGQYGGLADTDIHDIKSRSFEHFAKLVVQAGGEVDWRKTLLAFWRFGPDLREDEDFGTLGALWRLLPADTRAPDHSIWDHLDLTSAFAGAFSIDSDREAALLALSIGPVQSFIEAARTTSDLWAGSHLLARLAWEAMKPVCEAMGPDAILFPRLRGVPQVDLWLRDECGLDPDWFKNCDWTKAGTDANPLFAAALPNRFVAVVPKSQAQELARRVETAVRDHLQQLGQNVVNRLLTEVGYQGSGERHCHKQMRTQLAGFPEVHWAAVPFSLIRPRNVDKQRDLDLSLLAEAMAPFFGVESGKPCGFLATPAWQVLQKETKWDDNTTFFDPNPGVLYPAVYDLAERVIAAAKSTRPFAQIHQDGWRCSLTGETEWLTTDAAQLHWNKTYRAQQSTLWTALAEKRPAWAKKGEHLGALATVKRLWPTLFAEEVQKAVGGDVQRFVVSTHTMALAGQIEKWLERGGLTAPGFVETAQGAEPVALPRRLMKKFSRKPEMLSDAKRIPGLLDLASESDSDADRRKLERLVKRTLRNDQDEDARLETYYALLLMDGDRMGAWLSGDDDYAIPYIESFHPQVQDGIKPFVERNNALGDYFNQKRALSPNRHLSISGALNDFSLTLARYVVEEEHAGRLIYAGGDDVLAMLPVSELLETLHQLRCTYSGLSHKDVAFKETHNGKLRLELANGFALLDGTLMRLMGETATASIGAVIAHHQAPLGAVMRELRAAEKRAKNEGARDAFSITVIKRSGGAMYLTSKWTRPSGDSPMTCLRELSTALKDNDASRRAAYHLQAWGVDLPEPSQLGNEQYREMLQQLMTYQFKRQGVPLPKTHAWRLAEMAPLTSRETAMGFINNFLSVAEFLARKVRA